jgi:hypothetical protein
LFLLACIETINIEIVGARNVQKFDSWWWRIRKITRRWAFDKVRDSCASQERDLEHFQGRVSSRSDFSKQYS